MTCSYVNWTAESNTELSSTKLPLLLIPSTGWGERAIANSVTFLNLCFTLCKLKLITLISFAKY